MYFIFNNSLNWIFRMWYMCGCRPNFTLFLFIFLMTALPCWLKWGKKRGSATCRKCTSYFSWAESLPRFLQRSTAITSNRPRFRVDMRWSTTSEGGLRETERDVHAPGNQTKRSTSSDVLPPEMPLFAVVLPLPRVLPAQGSEHRSARPDGCALALARSPFLSNSSSSSSQ